MPMLIVDMTVFEDQSGPQILKPSRKKTKCPDCLECQQCSKRRCHLCTKGGHATCATGASELGPFITHGEYMAWKKKKMESTRVVRLKTEGDSEI